MPMKRLTICERGWNFNTVAFVSVNKTSGDAVGHCNIHVYSPVLCPAHGGVCVSNPWPKPGLSLYEWRQRSERMPVKPQPGLCGTIHVGTALWPHSDAQSEYTPSREPNPHLSPSYQTTDTDTPWTSALQLENMNLSPGILPAQSAYRMEWNGSTGVWVNRPQKRS